MYTSTSDHLTSVAELFSLMTLQLILATMTEFLKHENTLYRNYFWRVTLIKQVHLMVIMTMIQTQTLRVTDNIMKTCGCKWEPNSDLFKTT